ncbi:MAG: hypothetical protein CFH28_00208 [Alphaproteobacteria bacterium MarineAlpha6_Bin6]|nr:MAG: hypothetical protein CFH28_00208 [Alphaproteobacteria bacterium MarineAlpha6_Bin6]PPR32566.1 MAG: hypothetical protein CFH27_01198 [Alphaproteobacteria bacterium MarineAlpha6_Bin5]|tara:strand:+ start:257 stop:1222 length:966 start_codon:yes stop_codon:yes gene_type:complete
MLFNNKIKKFVSLNKIISKEEFKKKINDGFRHEVSKNKLKHDIEQINYLLKNKLISKKFIKVKENYIKVCSALPKESEPTDIFTLSKNFTKKLGPTFNNLIYFQPPDVIERTVINKNKKIVAKSSDKIFKYMVIDNFLNKDVLNILYKYCLSNSIWNEFDYKNGYIGSFIENGFNAPLLLQISEEIRFNFPKIIKKLPLTKAWAFKCNNQMKGIKIHADFAAINVNFWVTPDNANLNKNSGGLLVWDKEAPKKWDFEKYNNNHLEIKKFLKKKKSKMKKIKYKSNRVIIFNSNLFHASDNFNFKKNYENRRINMTFLYGKR